MADRRRAGATLAALGLAWLVLSGGAASPTTSTPVQLAFPQDPGGCDPFATRAPGTSADPGCPDSGPLGSFGPVLLYLALGLGGAALVGGAVAYLVLRRRAGPPMAPDPGSFWVCPTCGSTNIADSPRCYSCGTWRG